MLGPVLENLAQSAEGRWELVKVNTEDHPTLAARHRISSIPAVKLFRNGEVVDDFVGFRPEAQLRAWLAPHLDATEAAPVAPDELEVAAEDIDEGRITEARSRLEAILATTPDRHAASLLLAEILLTAEPLLAVERVERIPADANEYSHAQALALLARAAATPEGDLPEDPVKAVLLRGLAAVRQREWDPAMEAFIEVTERRRNYAGGLAAEAGKAIFRYLGIRHPVADKHYRRFSSALNS
jgi:putative thioredoxin